MSHETIFLPITDVSERDLDFVLAEEIECNLPFRAWLFEQTGGAPALQELIQLGRSISTVHGETDLLVVHGDSNGVRRAMLIENKISAQFTHMQSERYRIRGIKGIEISEWTEFVTVLVAPKVYLEGVVESAFDFQISYEDCEKALTGTDARASFKRRIFRAACSKAAAPWVKIVDSSLTTWFQQARTFGIKHFPDLPLPPEVEDSEGKSGRAPTSKWITFSVGSLPGSRVKIEIKPHNGVVDLRLWGVEIGDLRRELDDLKPGGSDTVKAGKSVSIRMQHPKVKTDLPFDGQEEKLRLMLDSADQLRRFAEKHRQKLMHLLGYGHAEANEKLPG